MHGSCLPNRTLSPKSGDHLILLLSSAGLSTALNMKYVGTYNIFWEKYDRAYSFDHTQSYSFDQVDMRGETHMFRDSHADWNNLVILAIQNKALDYRQPDTDEVPVSCRPFVSVRIGSEWSLNQPLRQFRYVPTPYLSRLCFVIPENCSHHISSRQPSVHI